MDELPVPGFGPYSLPTAQQVNVVRHDESSLSIIVKVLDPEGNHLVPVSVPMTGRIAEGLLDQLLAIVPQMIKDRNR